jgi:hypothetical protein
VALPVQRRASARDCRVTVRGAVEADMNQLEVVSFRIVNSPVNDRASAAPFQPRTKRRRLEALANVVSQPVRMLQWIALPHAALSWSEGFTRLGAAEHQARPYRFARARPALRRRAAATDRHDGEDISARRQPLLRSELCNERPTLAQSRVTETRRATRGWPQF